MELVKAQAIAGKIVQELKPFCDRIEIAGSIRRRCPFVHDIDLVVIPSSQGQFVGKLMEMGKIKLGGQKLIRVAMPEIELDIYVATPQTWATLLLIRTGSARHNVMLCACARQRGMVLHADGSGLFRLLYDCEGGESRVAGDTEESIFAALDLPYKKPEERE